MAVIHLNDGQACLVDEADLKEVSQHKWYCKNGYAATTYHRKGSSRTDKNRNVNVSMHRLLMGAEEGQEVDHIDRNRLNNQRSNLRVVSRSQNLANGIRSRAPDADSQYIGVMKCQGTENTFYARVAGEVVGYYHGEVAAAQARDLAIIAKYGTHEMPLNFAVADLPTSVEALPPKPNAGRTSKHKGVSFARNRKAQDKWRAVYKTKHLGWFATEEEAIITMKEAQNESY